MKRYYFYKGRVAFYALLQAFGVGKGDRVLVPGYTCVVVPFAIHYLGAIPEYADIDKETYNVSYANYISAFKRLETEGNSGSLKAIVIQHTYGNANADILEIRRWAYERNLFVIEDCCHIEGGIVEGYEIGTIGDAAFFSTQWSKPFTTGLGGIAQLNRMEYEEKMNAVEKQAAIPGKKETCILNWQVIFHTYFFKPTVYWIALDIHRALARMGVFVGSSTVNELRGEMPKQYLKRMGQRQQELLLRRQAEKENRNIYRRSLMRIYDDIFQKNGLSRFQYTKDAALLRYPVWVRDKHACLKEARKKRLELGDWFDHPLHPRGAAIQMLHWQDVYCPNAVQAAAHVVNLPLHFQMDEAMVKRITIHCLAYC